ncbi:AfsR/SARP family transcriptional regulator [Micromonospora eburnea]|uniref:DNA-binding transcriptional activator of the SARP family n=1 Tax=Micromonospora eburnea TaxID=227316 RepID=A0A1C6V1S0_9ACTN|nr:BTAD domain-containing putative transcriptional regulator [Micromonospora eburnea]SCL60205.1 DNA-binding transcriptional activator of the SARP family [Micromonospora eburnea]
MADVRVLGPLQAIGPAGSAALSSSRQRALVGLLALTPKYPIPVSKLVDGIWGDDAPRTAVRTLQSHLTRAKQELAACGLPDLLVATRVGYMMVVDPPAVDAHRFEGQVRAARRLLAEGDSAGAEGALSSALKLWYGEPLQGTELYGWGAAEVARLQEARLGAVEDLCDTQLRLGAYAKAADELERLLAAYPARERLVGLLMLARYRSGRHAEALTSYARLRAHLAEALGVDPGPQLQRLHTAMLRRDPALDVAEAAGPVSVAAPAKRLIPHELPSPVGHFTGRGDEIAALDDLLGDPTAPGGSAADKARVALLCGPAGMGKTAMAVEWAHRVADQFPDGQIFVDLHGHGPAAAATAPDVVCHTLRGLGVPPGRVPADPSDQVRLFRSLLRDRRVLLVCDNAGSAEQVLPLVPPTSGCLLLVTSRNALPALGVRNALRRVELDVLDHPDAISLLERVLGVERVRQEVEAAEQLVTACGGMPLALRTAAAKLASRPRLRIADLVADLATEHRLDALSVPGDSRGIRTVFASAYDTVSELAATAFRAIGLHPGPSFAAPLVAAATGTSPAVGRQVTDELATVHLTSEQASGRFACHDLIRLYARECALAVDPPDRRTETVERILDWYLAIADAANTILTPARTRATVTLRHGPIELPFASRHRDALVFLDAERENLVPVSRYAVGHGYDTAAWQLAYLLMGFFNSRGHWVDMLEICRGGLAAAQRQGDRHVEALMRGQLGVACIQVQRYEEALRELRSALPLMQAAGDAWGEGSVHNNTAVALTMLRRFDEAIAEYEYALAVHTARGVSSDVAYALHNLGDAHTRCGRPDVALHHLARAHDLAVALDDQRLHAVIWQASGAAHLRRGAYQVALQLLHSALALHREIGDQSRELDTLRDIGSALLDVGSVSAALDIGAHALRLSRQIGDPHREAVALQSLGLAHLRAGSFPEAEQHFQFALELRLRIPDAYEEAEIHRAFSELEARRGSPAAAHRHHGTAVDRYRSANATVEAHELASAGWAGQPHDGVAAAPVRS